MKKLFFFLLVITFHFPVKGQTSAQPDDKIAAYLKNIEHWYYDTSGAKYDSLAAANKSLLAYFMSAPVAKQVLETTSFKKAKKIGFWFVSSPDGKIRFYSWDTEEGGSMRFFNNVAHYKDELGVHTAFLNDTTIEGGDCAGMYTGITSVVNKEGKVVYLVTQYSIASNKDRAEKVTAYTISHGRLLRQPIFKTTSKLLDQIEYGYDSFAAEFPENAYPKIRFSKDNKTLYIPIVIGDKLSSRSLVYKFNGNNYVFDKNAK